MWLCCISLAPTGPREQELCAGCLGPVPSLRYQCDVTACARGCQRERIVSVKRSDSVFEEIRVTGVWWLAGARRRRVHGTVTGSVAAGFTLEIEEALEDMEAASSDITIQGKTKDDDDITLFSCFLQHQRGGFFGLRGGRSSYCVQGVLIGALYEAWEGVRFRRLSFGLHLLEEWHCVAAFKPLELYDLIMSGEPMTEPVYSQPAPVELHNDGLVRTTLEYEVSLPGSRMAQTEMTIGHGARIIMESSGGVLPFFSAENSSSHRSFMAMMNSLTRFFSFAFSAATFPYAVLGVPHYAKRARRRARLTKPIQILLPRKIPRVLPERRAWEMDLQRKHMTGTPSHYVQNWIEKAPSLFQADFSLSRRALWQHGIPGNPSG